jgi:hypothetical protein
MKKASVIVVGLVVALTVGAETSHQDARTKSQKGRNAKQESSEWTDQDKKTAAVTAVLRYIGENHEEGKKCVGKGNVEACAVADMNTKALFKAHGNNMDIPGNSRALIFDENEWDLGAGRSVILAIPPPDLNIDDQQKLLTYALNYVHWPPQSSVQVPRAPDGKPLPWYDPEPKRNAILKVLTQMVKDPKQAEALVGNDKAAHEFFNKYGGIGDVPIGYGARVIVFPTNELGSEYKGHVWLYLPKDTLMYWGNRPSPPTSGTDRAGEAHK